MPQAAVLEKEPLQQSPRRFELPDLDTHGGWLVQRLVSAYRHLNDRQIAGWLRGLMYQNEFSFVYLPNSVGLARAIQPDILVPRVMIQEHFLWAKDPKDNQQVQEAASIYDWWKKWAVLKDAQLRLVGEHSDVPPALIEKKLGPLLERTQAFVRL